MLSFAIIMLNTSLHNHNVRDKPTAERFITMNRGINEGGDLPEELLRVSCSEPAARCVRAFSLPPRRPLPCPWSAGVSHSAHERRQHQSVYFKASLGSPRLPGPGPDAASALGREGRTGPCSSVVVPERWHFSSSQNLYESIKNEPFKIDPVRLCQFYSLVFVLC